jgi:hypothetical protein
VKLVNLNIDNLDLYEYSKLLCTKSIIYQHILCNQFLVFQTDSMILKQNKDMINDFLQYDYVGAPWFITGYIPTKNCNFIGNGGLSLRNKNKMLEIIDKIEWNHNNEDLYFSTHYNNISINKPEYIKAITFSVDEVFSTLAFGCHKPWLNDYYNTFRATRILNAELFNKKNTSASS